MSWPFLRLLGSGQPPSSCLHGHSRKPSGMGPATHFWRRSTGLNVVPKRSTSTLAATPSLVEVGPPEFLRVTERETPRPADHRMDRKPPRRRPLPLWLHARHGIRLPVLANLALGLHPELVRRGGIADLMPGTRPALLEGCAAAVWLSGESPRPLHNHHPPPAVGDLSGRELSTRVPQRLHFSRRQAFRALRRP